MKTSHMMIVTVLACAADLAYSQPASQTGGGAEPGLISNANFDADGDGKLSDTEKKSMNQELKALAAVREKMLIKKYDADGDGKLSSEEKASMKAGQEAKTYRVILVERYDTNKDGKLSDEEKTAMYMQQTANRRALLEKYDADKNGILDETELETAGKASDSTRVQEMIDGQPMRKGSNAPSSSQ